MTTPRHTPSRSNDTITMSPRTYAAILGIAAAFTALLFLGPISVSITEDLSLATIETDCGTGFSPVDIYSGSTKVACDDAISTRRAWAWPLFGVGVAVFAGAVLIRPQRKTPQT